MKLNRTITAAAVTATAALAIGAGALPASASTPPVVVVTSPADHIPACRASQLHLTLGHERAATGHITLTVTATDEGPACTLPAFPSLRLTGARGQALPTVVTTTGKGKPRLAQYHLSYRFTLSFGSDGVHGVRASGVSVNGGKASFGATQMIYGGQLTVTTWKAA